MAKEGGKKQLAILLTGLGILVGLVAIMVLVAWLAIYICYLDEITTIKSVHKISDRPVWEVNYTSDYKFNEYLRQGSHSLLETQEFLEKNLCGGLDNFLSAHFKCSAFFAKTPEGDYILARNMDYYGEIFPAILKLSREDGIRSIGISSFNEKKQNIEIMRSFEAIYTPYFTYDGMNEHGVAVAAISTCDSYSIAKRNQVSIYDIEAVRLILDQAKNVEDAKQLVKKYHIALSEHSPSHFIICDAEGNSVVVEYVNGSLQVIENNGSYQILTDFLLFSGEKSSDQGAQIYQVYKEVLNASKGVISIEDAMDLLRKNRDQEKGQWSVIYNVTKKTMTVSFSDDKNKVYEYSFS